MKGKKKDKQRGAIRMRISGKEHGKIMALKAMVSDRSLIPSVIRTCVVYYLSYGKYPCVGAVTSKMIDDAKERNDSYDAVISFPEDAMLYKFLDALELSGRLGGQLISFTERCIDICEEGQEWGCSPDTLQDIILQGFNEQNGLPVDYTLIRKVTPSHGVQQVPLKKGSESTGAGKERKYHDTEQKAEHIEETVSADYKSDYYEIFSKGEAFGSIKEFRNYVLGIPGFCVEMADAWREYLRNSGDSLDVEKKIGIIRMRASLLGEDAGW